MQAQPLLRRASRNSSEGPQAEVLCEIAAEHRQSAESVARGNVADADRWAGL